MPVDIILEVYDKNIVQLVFSRPTGFKLGSSNLSLDSGSSFLSS